MNTSSAIPLNRPAENPDLPKAPLLMGILKRMKSAKSQFDKKTKRKKNGHGYHTESRV